MAQGRSQLAAVTLDDKYILEKGRVYLTGTQALVRLPMVQRQRDAAAGLNTGCFITGYRGSPLGGLDLALWGRAALHRAQPHPLSAGDQRGDGGDRGVGQPAARAVSRRQIRWRLCHVVRQRARGRPQRRCAEARQFRRVGAAWRGAGARRRRPHLQILDPGAPVGIRLYRRLDPGAEPGRGRGDPRSRPLWLGDVALFRVLGRVQDRRRIDGQLGLDRGRSGPGRDRAADRFRDAAGRAQHPLAGSAAGAGAPAAPLEARRRRWRSPAPTGSTAS